MYLLYLYLFSILNSHLNITCRILILLLFMCLAEKSSRTGTREMINAVGEHQCMIISSYSRSHCRYVAISLPAAVKYSVLTSSLRYTSLSAREMRDPGKGCDDLVTLSRTGNLASVHRITLVLSANIYFVRRWAYTLFYSPCPKYRSLVPRWSQRSLALDIRDGVSICVTSRNFRAVEQFHKSFERLSWSHGE